MTPNYENDHSRLLNRLALDADALARKAGAWFDQLATAKAEAATAQDAFLADFHADSAARFAEAQTRVRDLTTVATAVENSGGPTEARARALLTPAA